MRKTVAIIGAGLAGLAAARRLTEAGEHVLLLEKSRGVGGRAATRRVGDYVLDHGAQVLKTDGSLLGDVMQRELPTKDLLEVDPPIQLYAANGSLTPPDPKYAGERKFCYRNGMTTLPKLLLAALPPELSELRLNVRVGSIEENGAGLELLDDEGHELCRADAVIVSAPAPQAADLLEASHLLDREGTARRVEALRRVSFTACLSVLLGYAAPAPVAPAYALLAADRSRPLLWLAFEQAKSPERVPVGAAALIAQLGPDFSRDQYETSDEEIFAVTMAELKSIFGNAYATPEWKQIKRWRYSQPMGCVNFAEVNPTEASRKVLVCGDALRPGNGRMHEAYASGIEAAQRLLD